MDVFSSTISEDSHAQMLQSQLIEREYELNKKLNEAKAEIKSIHHASKMTKKWEGRGSNSISKTRKFKLQQARAVITESKLQEKEVDLDKVVNKLNKTKDELAKSKK